MVVVRGERGRGRGEFLGGEMRRECRDEASDAFWGSWRPHEARETG